MTQQTKYLGVITCFIFLISLTSCTEELNMDSFTGAVTSSISGVIDEASNLIEETTTEKIIEDTSKYVKEITLPNDDSQRLQEIEVKIFEYTNNERVAHGLPSLKWDSKLANVAREHSFDMANNDFFAHENLRGEDPTQRAIRNGYNVHKELGNGWYSDGIAENIGMMPTGNVVGMGYISNDVESIAKAHVDSWMESPGHRENILTADYNLFGAGVAYDGLYYVATQNFK
jgi:uncharacterized protein YkwD